MSFQSILLIQNYKKLDYLITYENLWMSKVELLFFDKHVYFQDEPNHPNWLNCLMFYKSLVFIRADYHFILIWLDYCLSEIRFVLLNKNNFDHVNFLMIFFVYCYKLEIFSLLMNSFWIVIKRNLKNRKIIEKFENSQNNKFIISLLFHFNKF